MILLPFNIMIVKVRRKNSKDFNDFFVADFPENQIIHLNKLSDLSENIRGMINYRAGEELFSLAYMQSLKGDVVEVGSATATTSSKLVDSVKLFTETVEVGDLVFNTTDNTIAIVSAVDSDTTLSIDTNIMESGEGYKIFSKTSNSEKKFRQGDK